MSDVATAVNEDLLSWGVENGAFVHDGLDLFAQSERAERGIVARKPLKAGEVLLRIPGQLSLQSCCARMPDSEIADFWRRSSEPVSNAFRLTLTMMHELHVQKSRSRWWPYLNFLATSVQLDLPMSWSQNDLEGLKGTASWLSSTPAQASDIFERVVMPIMVANPDLWPKEIQTTGMFLQTLSWVMSRGFCGALSFEVGGAFLPELMAESKSTTGPFLLPLFDLINHSSWSEEHCVQLDVEAEDFVVRCSKDVAIGSELFKSYGEHSDAELLRTYGFVEMGRSNPNNVLVATQQELLEACRPSSIGNEAERLARVQNLLKPVYAIPASGVLPAELLTVVQVILIDRKSVV